jgi:hypothetical protein
MRFPSSLRAVLMGLVGLPLLMTTAGREEDPTGAVSPTGYTSWVEAASNGPRSAATNSLPLAQSPAPPRPPQSSPGGLWSPEAHVTPIDQLLNGGQAAAVDGEGRPWVVWYRGPFHSGALPIYWTRWEGDSWRAV